DSRAVDRPRAKVFASADKPPHDA
ncbi:MAG: hypothetical protein AVDCRST_MAG40-46, partial [uncultured Gemmatimonadaceae bacterium]